MRIALHRPGAIGDIIMTLNLVPELKRKYPDCSVDYFCSSYIGNSLKYIMLHAGIANVLNCDDFQRMQINYDLAFNLVGYPKQEGYPEKPMNKHLIQYFADELGLDSTKIYSLVLPPPCRISNLPSSDYATLQTKTGWSHYKEWPIDKWAEVIKNCAFPVVQIGDAQHPKVPGAIHHFMGSELITAISLVANARIHMGVDSFANHLTNYNWAVNNNTRKVRAAILWGSTQWNAAGYEHNINISLGLPCQPCFRENPSVSREPRGPCINPPGQIDQGE
jgi:ADP-heptose:LPS heptosyltransferase